jgi:hypothetical protein
MKVRYGKQSHPITNFPSYFLYTGIKISNNNG